MSDQTYADFELVLEMKPEWPADTGVMVRRRPETWEGFQVLVDHRKSGSIGGFYGNGTGGTSTPYRSFSTPHTTAKGDREEEVEETPDKPALLTRRGDAANFLARWRFGDWNQLRIRCIGAKPTITSWVNDVLIAEIDLATIDHPHYDADAVADVLGRSGHIALEVHDNDPIVGELRWGRGARCRWRSIAIKEL